jgi:hypothetical protein
VADLTPEREAQIRTGLTSRLEALDYTIGDLAARDLLAELDTIRTRGEAVGWVLSDVIRRALAGELDEHGAVRAIEVRLVYPLVAQMREARAKAARAAGRRRNASTAAETEVAQLRAELAEERLTVDALRKNRDQLADELTAARAELAARPKSRLGEQVNRLSNAGGDLEHERDEALAAAAQLRAILGEVLDLRQNGESEGGIYWRDLDRRIEHAVRAGEEPDR